ncbi:ANKFY1 [Cordylochernes scorpioides]|uniref:ANKFY1 n=1 Tax=Cordylochernes scorpioides TaxID=51811 RepID=A0ABY6JYN1_9ARAC|nr:ANKFY1 [Cordylochernes scorpioides]
MCWVQDDFGPEDFAHMKAPLLYKMLKAKSPHPLHASIKIKREDVVFLYLIEFDSQVCCLPSVSGEPPCSVEILWWQLHDRLNQLDSEGLLPLELALSSRQDSVATSLVSHGANVDGGLSSGETLLHRAIRNGKLQPLFLFTLLCVGRQMFSVTYFTSLSFPPLPVPSPDEKGGGGAVTSSLKNLGSAGPADSTL